jgi:ferric-dicitrate binding protein FerR (iron transport regulator)
VTFTELLVAWEAGLIDEDGTAELKELLKDPAHRYSMVNYLRGSEVIRCWFEDLEVAPAKTEPKVQVKKGSSKAHSEERKKKVNWVHILSLVLGVGAAVGAAVFLLTRVNNPGQIGTVGQVSGQASLFVNNAKTTISAGAIVPPGASLVTMEDSSRAEVIMKDGSRVELEGPASTALSSDTGWIIVSHTRGKLNCSIRPQPTGKPFRVWTPRGYAFVPHGELRVVADAGSTRIDVQSGNVRFVEHSTKRQVSIPPGQYAISAKDTYMEVFTQ